MDILFITLIGQCIVQVVGHGLSQAPATQHSTHGVSCKAPAPLDWSTADTKTHRTLYESNWFVLDLWAGQ